MYWKKICLAIEKIPLKSFSYTRQPKVLQSRNQDVQIQPTNLTCLPSAGLLEMVESDTSHPDTRYTHHPLFCFSIDSLYISSTGGKAVDSSTPTLMSFAPAIHTGQSIISGHDFYEIGAMCEKSICHHVVLLQSIDPRQKNADSLFVFAKIPPTSIHDERKF